MPRWFKITLWALLASILIMIFVIWWSLENLSWDLSAMDDGHRLARNDFYETLATPDCLTRDEIIAEAQSRGWQTRDQDEFIWSHIPAGLGNWLRVTVEPPLFMSTDDENAAFFGFDTDGCSVEWSYGNGLNGD